MDYSVPGTPLPNGAIVIDTTDGGRVFAILPDNTVTPWVSWSYLNPDNGQCTSGTYYYTFAEAMQDWTTRKGL